MVEDKNIYSYNHAVNEFNVRAITTYHTKALFDCYVVLALTNGDAAIIYLNDGRLDVMLKGILHHQQHRLENGCVL
eukprot:scaffold1521_cov271-Chaetoceros_neogracile.AAC.51